MEKEQERKNRSITEKIKSACLFSEELSSFLASFIEGEGKSILPDEDLKKIRRIVIDGLKEESELDLISESRLRDFNDVILTINLKLWKV